MNTINTNTNTNATTIPRNDFGALIGNAVGANLLALAIKTRKVEHPYVDVDRKHRGWALSYDVYDVRGKTAIIQRRLTKCTKYGNSPTKSYLLLEKVGNGVRVTDIDQYKARIVKMAKAQRELGGVVEIIKRELAA